MSRDTVAMKSMDSEKVRVQREHCDPAIIAATLVVAGVLKLVLGRSLYPFLGM